MNCAAGAGGAAEEAAGGAAHSAEGIPKLYIEEILSF